MTNGNYELKTYLDLGDCGEYRIQVEYEYSPEVKGCVIDGVQQEPDYPAEIDVLTIFIVNDASENTTDFKSFRLNEQLLSSSLIESLIQKALNDQDNQKEEAQLDRLLCEA